MSKNNSIPLSSNSNVTPSVLSPFGLDVANSVAHWRNTMKFGYPSDIATAFGGVTLDHVFGPVSQRVPMSSLSKNLNDYNRKKEAIRKYKSANGEISNGKLHIENLVLVDINTVFKLVIRAFNEIIDPVTGKGVLYGYQLKSYDLNNAAIAGTPYDSKFIMINMAVQRDPSLLRIFKLLVDFDSSLSLGGTGHVSIEEERVYCNDGQHGALTLLFHGVLTIPMIVTYMNTSYMGFNQFIARNHDVLPISIYDTHKVLVNRAKEFVANGLTIKCQDLASYNLDRVFSDCNVRLVHEDVSPKPGETNSTAQFQKHFKNYCNSMYENREIFELAIKITRQAWRTSPLMHEPVWGLIELLSKQPAAVIKHPEFLISVSEILALKWNSANAVWKDVNSQIKKQYPIKERNPLSNLDEYTEYKDHRYTNSGNRGLMIAAGIKSVVDNYEAWAQQNPELGLSYNLVLAPVTNSGGQFFEIDIPFKSQAMKNSFTMFKPTVE
jgi:hypothetical protein